MFQTGASDVLYHNDSLISKTRLIFLSKIIKTENEVITSLFDLYLAGMNWREYVLFYYLFIYFNIFKH